MSGHTVLVINNPTSRYLGVLEKLPTATRILVGETEEAFRRALPEADVVVAGGTHRPILQGMWPQLTNLKWVHSMAAGLEGLLFPELIESPIPLTNSRGVFARSLGEFALAGMLYFAKDLNRMRANQARGNWEQFDVLELHGATLGIVGYGEIGRAAAARAKPFGMRIHTLRRRPERNDNDSLVDRTFPVEAIRQLAASSDYLLAAAPLTPDTRGMIDDSVLRCLPAHAVVINLGRGPVIVEDALVDALQNNRIRGAVLDVFDTEPLPQEHPFWSLDNVLLSPHTADHTATWMEEAMQLFVDNFERYRTGQPLENIADKQNGY